MSTNFTEFIFEDLRSKIATGQDVELSLRKLASQYGISTRPVGQAIDKLVKENYLQRLSNGRLATKSLTKTAKKKALKANALANPQNAQKEIEHYLVSESLKGTSVHLIEEEMAKKFNIGRTALRNIFSELSQTGLISHTPRKGWRLKEFGEKDLNDYLAVREQLELMALDLSKGSLDKEILKKMHANNAEPKSDNNSQGDNTLHAYFISKANNHYITSFFERHSPLFVLLFSWEGKDKAMQKNTRAQHRQILKHLINDDLEKAKQALSNHIWNNHELLIELIKKRKNKPAERSNHEV